MSDASEVLSRGSSLSLFSGFGTSSVSGASETGVHANVEDLRSLTVAEVGVPVSMTSGPALEGPIETIEYYADLAASYDGTVDLGNIGDLVKVKPGYGRNYLVPQGKAVPATSANIAEFEKRRAELEKAAKAKLSGAEERLGAFEGLEIKLSANASEEGKLYGSIGPREIADAVTATGLNLEKSEVIMGEGPIRYTGEHDVVINLHADVETEIKVIVEAE